MPKIAPFKATFPAKGLENKVAVNTHLPLTEEQLTEHLEQNPFSYYHIFKPQFHFSENDKTGKFFSFGKNYFRQLKEQGVLVKDKEKALYVYKITNPDNSSFIGIVANVDAEDYEKGLIKKHESTLVEKEDLLVKHLSGTNLIGEPVLLTYPANSLVDKTIQETIALQPDIDFTHEDGSEHLYWKIFDTERINKLKKGFEEIEALYIADGHHRCASLYKYIRQSGLNSCNMLACLVSDEQLRIYPFYRLLKTDTPPQAEQLLLQLSGNFNVVEANTDISDLQPDEMLMLLQDKTYKLQLKPDKARADNLLDGLNVALLERYVLQPCFGVEDSREDPRLDFLSGKIDRETIRQKIRVGEASVAFSLAPLQARDIFDVSDKNLVMPPKSTYIEPKLFSGSLILEF